MSQAPERTSDQREVSPAWSEALRTRVTVPTQAHAVAGASRRDDAVSRRRFIAASFWGGVGAALLAATGSVVDFLYPRNVAGFGGPVPAGNIADYPVGADPVHHVNGHFWIVNLDPAEDAGNGSGGCEGLLALWRKCPHLGCTVPWRQSFVLQEAEGGDGSEGWFRCPCHGSTYTKAGVRVFGPAPRSMDTMRVEVDEDGAITVQTGEITSGGTDNPTRALRI